MSIILTVILILTILPSNLAIHTSTDNYRFLSFEVTFSQPEIVQDEDFVRIKLAESTSFTMHEFEPMIPYYIETLELPFGSKIIDISIQNSEVSTLSVDHQVIPVLEKNSIGEQTNVDKYLINKTIYSSKSPYPNEWYSVITGAGLNNKNEHVLFLSFQLYPVHYVPLENNLVYSEYFEVEILYKEPTSTFHDSNFEDYDLVIICPDTFSENLDPLVDHKNSCGVNTKLVTLQEIYSQFYGRDNCEKIKFFIKDAVDNCNTKYVLLVGDIKKLPIRTTYASWWERDILSDLYYGDIYDSEYKFCSWDGNENNKFGETLFVNNRIVDVDEVDLFADVHVGRLACSNKNEVDVVVNKIITYENFAADQLWFNKIILAGGDTFPLSMGSLNVFEGEITNKKVMQQLPNFDHITLWASNNNLNAITFNSAINKGAGFVTYAGHGFEHGWGTYKPNSLRKKMGFTQPLYYMPFVEYLKNENKLPIIFFDACLTAKLDFNITDLKEYYPKLMKIFTFAGILEDDPNMFYPCFAWSFLKKEGGGAIATIGSTRTAYTYVDKDGVYAGAGYLDVHFFKSYEEGITAGEMLTQAQNDYINHVYKDFFTIEEFILVGDPSLMVGGRP